VGGCDDDDDEKAERMATNFHSTAKLLQIDIHIMIIIIIIITYTHTHTHTLQIDLYLYPSMMALHKFQENNGGAVGEDGQV
jgi:hypothetical protein